MIYWYSRSHSSLRRVLCGPVTEDQCLHVCHVALARLCVGPVTEDQCVCQAEGGHWYQPPQVQTHQVHLCWKYLPPEPL